LICAGGAVVSDKGHVRHARRPDDHAQRARREGIGARAGPPAGSSPSRSP